MKSPFSTDNYNWIHFSKGFLVLVINKKKKLVVNLETKVSSWGQSTKDQSHAEAGEGYCQSAVSTTQSEDKLNLKQINALGHFDLIHCFPFPAHTHFMSRNILFIMLTFIHYWWCCRSCETTTTCCRSPVFNDWFRMGFVTFTMTHDPYYVIITSWHVICWFSCTIYHPTVRIDQQQSVVRCISKAKIILKSQCMHWD